MNKTMERLNKAAFKACVLDSLQYLEDAQDYLSDAFLCCCAIQQIRDSEMVTVDKWFEWLFSANERSFDLAEVFGEKSLTWMNAFGENVSSNTARNLVVRTFFHSLNSFADIYAHFLHRALLGGQRLQILDNCGQIKTVDKIDFYNLVKALKCKLIRRNSKLQNISCLVDNFVDDEDGFKYVRAVDNSLKHNFIINPKTELCMNKRNYRVYIKGFIRNGQEYPPRDLEETFTDLYRNFNNFYNNSTLMVIDALETASDGFGQKRVHCTPGLQFYGTGEPAEAVYELPTFPFDKEINLMYAWWEDNRLKYHNSYDYVIRVVDPVGKEWAVLRASEEIRNRKDYVQFVEYRKYTRDF